MSEGVEGILDNILRKEGPYQNDPEDWKGNTNSAGELVGTNWGISAPVYEKVLGRPPSVADMKAISRDEAREIYREQYIAPVEKTLGIPPTHPAYHQVVDMYVNHSPKAVAAMLQRAAGTKVDGVPGPQTRKAALSVLPEKLNNALVEHRKAYYNQLMKQDPALEKYRNGWLGRADSFLIQQGQSDGDIHTQEES